MSVGTLCQTSTGDLDIVQAARILVKSARLTQSTPVKFVVNSMVMKIKWKMFHF